jgi:hypothetical protein
MEIISLEGTEDTPKIILDSKNGIFEISGRSLPEDTAEFYQPVLEWLDKYAESNPLKGFEKQGIPSTPKGEQDKQTFKPNTKGVFKM